MCHMDRVEHPGLTQLRFGKYNAAYKQRLLQGGKELYGFLAKQGIESAILSRSRASKVDELLTSFLNKRLVSGSSRDCMIGKHAILFIQICRPRLKGKLQTAWSTLKAWEEQRASSYRAPLPISLLVALVCRANMHGFKGENGSCDKLWWKFSSLVLAGFFGLLRPGELFRLRKQDVGLPNSISLGSLFASVRVQQPKNARQMGRHQFAIIRNVDAVNWLSWCTSCCKEPNSFLWPSTPQKFRKMFKQLCSELKISHCKFTPASLRAGGATWEIDRDSCNIAQLRFEGRWANLRSLEHYIQVARAQQLLLSIPEETSQRLRRWIGDHFFLLTLPPFLSQEVPSRFLLESTPTLDCKPSDVVVACRGWGNHQGSSKAV